jgi:glycosyltransferase involved in cell wall biosynthesis
MLKMQGFEHVRIWPRGVENTLFQPGRRSEALRTSWLQGQDNPADKAILLYVGRISWEKNLRLLIQAYRQMDHTRCHLVIVGQGPAYAEVEQDLRQVPVTFTGYLSGEELATAYESADIFAFPSYTETFGQVVLEAMASGLPVVGVQSEGVCDLVEHGRTGLLLAAEHHSENEQIAGYRAHLERLIQHPDERTDMSSLALSAALPHTWYEAMELLVQGYSEVVARSHVAMAA